MIVSMKEGMWYKCVEHGEYINEGEFCRLDSDDGTEMPFFQTPIGGFFLYKSRFDPTPHIKTPDGRFVPEKENTMIEGKWYKCIDASGGARVGEFWELKRKNNVEAYFRWDKGIEGRGRWMRTSCFDPTPHDRTVFPNAPDLIERVRRIDPAAAEWLEFGDHSAEGLHFNPGARSIGSMFAWDGAPHGRWYWVQIAAALNRGKIWEETMSNKDFKKGERVEVRDDEDEDWVPATFLCIDDGADYGCKYVVNPDGLAKGFQFCRRPTAPARPYIKPGTPIEAWDEKWEKPSLERFGRWLVDDAEGHVLEDKDEFRWKHCRVLAPTGVEV